VVWCGRREKGKRWGAKGREGKDGADCGMKLWAGLMVRKVEKSVVAGRLR
jgi:hypothetical protein